MTATCGADGIVLDPNLAVGSTLSDIPEATADLLTVSSAKAECYRLDPHFRGGVRALGPSPNDTRLASRVLVVFKPDAVAGRRVRRCVDLFVEQGFRVTGAAPFRFTPLLTRELWRYQFNIASQDRQLVVDLLLPASSSLAVVLEDDRWEPGALPASCRLGMTKGSSNPAARRVTDLRSRLDAPTTLFNFVHTADEPADVLREAALLDLAGDLGLLTRVVSRTPLAAVPEPVLASVIDELDMAQPAHDLDESASALRLLQRASFRDLAESRANGQLSWRAVLDRCPGGRPKAEDLWDVLSLATAQIDCNVPGLVPVLPTVSARQWIEMGRVDTIRPRG